MKQSIVNPSIEIITSEAEPVQVVTQFTSEAEFVESWAKRSNSANTQAIYASHSRAFLDYVGVPLSEVRIPDVQAYKAHLMKRDLKPASINQHLAAVKSLLSYGCKTGVLRVNVGAAVTLLPLSDELAARILEQPDILRIIALESDPRNHALLTLLYYSGGRVSEVCALTWSDLQPREDGGGQVKLYGKNGKTRNVRLSARVWSMLTALRPADDSSSPVFLSKKGGHLSRVQILRIVQASTKRAGVTAHVSPHWFRHAHASHALDGGCPVHVLKDTLGHASLATTSRYAHARPQESSSDYLK